MPYFGKTPAETALQTDDLESNIVTTAKLADDSVTGAKLNIPLVAGDVIYASATDTMAKLAKGTAAQVLTMNTGATAPEWAAAGGGLQSVQVFTASGTWTRPSGITHVDITVIAGGGGGGSTPSSATHRAASGGGEGEEAHLFLDVTAAAHASVEVTVGAGGVAGNQASGGAAINGGTGGTTTFEVSGGTNLTAIGGAGGQASHTAPRHLAGGIGGTGGTGEDYAFPGNVGGQAWLVEDTNDIGSGPGGGRGGGNARDSQSDPQHGPGLAGIANSGGGGSGASSASGAGSTTQLGGVGGSGICIVKEYIK